MTNSKNQKGLSLLSLALAGAIGATLGIIFAPKSGEEMRQDIADQASNMVKKFKESRAAIQENLKEIFGEVTDELERSYIEMRADIIAKVEEAKDLSERKYKEIVGKIVDEFSEHEEWPTKISEKLKKSFESHWSEMKEDVEKKS